MMRTAWVGTLLVVLWAGAGCQGSTADATTSPRPVGDSGDAGSGGEPDGGTGPVTGADGGGVVDPDGGTDGGTPTDPDGGTPTQPVTPPFTRNGWTFYGTEQGLSQDISDVSADEAGNVYVAGGDALYAKTHDGQAFLRFDASNAGLSKTCYVSGEDPASLDGKQHPTPPSPAIQCPIISVGGAAAGKAVIGFKGLGTDGDNDADWAQATGGADVVSFDGAQVARDRHVFIASPPGTICVEKSEGCKTKGMSDPSCTGIETFADSCSDPYDPFFWQVGRRKLRQVERIVVNHDAASPTYGDVFMAGTHASITVLLHDAAARGWVDKTAGQGAYWADAKDVWEHDHPGVYVSATNQFLTGETFAVAMHPTTHLPWVSNGIRTGWLYGYGASVSNKSWWLVPEAGAYPLRYDLWRDAGDPTDPLDPLGPTNDTIQALAFCGDGTLWVGSATHGLARFDPSTTGNTDPDAIGGVTYLDLPDPNAHGDNVYALACDPTDSSLWIGLGWGGVMRLKDGNFTPLDPNDQQLPAFTHQPVRSIQIDPGSATRPRTVYFAFMPSKDAGGNITQGGGVASYNGK
jgi:hypothetical protein